MKSQIGCVKYKPLPIYSMCDKNVSFVDETLHDLLSYMFQIRTFCTTGILEISMDGQLLATDGIAIM